MTILYFPLRNVYSLMGHVSCSSHLSSNSACCFISFDFISLSSTYYPVWDPGGYTHIRWTGVLSGNFEKSLSEIPRSCFVGVVWTFSTFKRYQFWKNTLTDIFTIFDSDKVVCFWIRSTRKRLRAVLLSLSLSCVTRKKTARKKWPREILRAFWPQDFTRFSFGSSTTD